MKNKKKKVLILSSNDDSIYCFRKEMIEAFIEEKFSVVVGCIWGEKLNLMPDIGIEYIDIKLDRRGINIYKDLKLILQYIAVFREKKPDVILCYTIKPNIYGSLVARIMGIPYINNLTGLGSLYKKGIVVRKIVLMLIKMAFKKSKCVFFQNNENMKLAKNMKLISGKIELLPGSGVDLNRFPIEKYPKDDKIIFNYIGRILKDKGIDDYLDVAQKIREKHKNTEFNVIGFVEPTEKEYIEKLRRFEKNHIIIYRGPQDDVRPFIKRAHAIIHPSKYGEGMSNVLLENAASGRVLITTDMPGCKETVDDNSTGFIYKAGDVNQLENTIEKFLSLKNSEREEMGIKGRNKVEKNFSREIVIEKYINEIEEL